MERNIQDVPYQDFLFLLFLFGINNVGAALKMLKVNPNLATAKDEDEENALYVLTRNPSTFVSGSWPGLLRRHLNIPCELFQL